MKTLKIVLLSQVLAVGVAAGQAMTDPGLAVAAAGRTFELTSVSEAARKVDGNPNVIHPGVVCFPTNWHGYRWWMAYTGYPDASREKPSIVASTNGYDWETPPGLTNPISDAHTYPSWFKAQVLEMLKGVAAKPTDSVQFTADTELTWLADGRLACYFCGFGRNGLDSTGDTNAGWSVLLRQTSTNGVNWTYPPEVVLWTADWGTNKGQVRWANLDGPRIVHEPDGSLKLFCNNWNFRHRYGSNSTYTVQTGDATGTNWSAPALCQGVPADGWHFDVWKGAYRYYMLGIYKSEAQGKRLWLAESRNATNWTLLSQDAFPPPAMSGKFAFGDPENISNRVTTFYTPKVIPIAERKVNLFVSYLSTSTNRAVEENWGRILVYPEVTLPDPNNLHELYPDSRGLTPLTIFGTNQFRPDLAVTNTGGSYLSLGRTLGGGYAGLQLFYSPSGHSVLDNALWGNSNQTVMNVPSASGSLTFRAHNNPVAHLSSASVLSVGEVAVTNGVALRPTSVEPTGPQLGPNGAVFWNSNGNVYLYMSVDGQTITTKKLIAP